jgi:phospholipid/cholesterol/gamma-HCH transport system permease protein
MSPAKRVVASPRGELDSKSSTSCPSYEIASDEHTIYLGGELGMQNAAGIWTDLRKLARQASDHVMIDLSRVRSAEGGVVALVVEVRNELVLRGVTTQIVNAGGDVGTLVSLYAGDQAVVRPIRRKPESMIAHIGRASLDTYREVVALLDFVGSLIHAALSLLRNPRRGHWKSIGQLCEETGANAVPIVLLINFLVGFVMAFQSAKQLKMFGANIYVADLVGISLTRELAPLMTAIIICGRSGAAFAAELGSMKVNEEVDALRTLGIAPLDWLVVPRIVALILVAPLLTLMADAVGILGGLLVGVISLELTAQGYYIETLHSVHGWDILTGLIKSVVFATAISLVACQQGLAATGGAESVGRRTTASVVTSLFSLVLIDSIFTILFRTFDV